MHASSAQSLFVASDIGGTVHGHGRPSRGGRDRRCEAPSTPAELVQGVLDTFSLAAADNDLELGDFVTRIRLFSHGTTLATNARRSCQPRPRNRVTSHG